MKKLFLIFTFLGFYFFNAQSNYTLKLKFDEKYFLSHYLKFKIRNKFSFDLIKKTDSISQIEVNKNYIDILDSIMIKKINLNEEQRKYFTESEKKEFDSLSKLAKEEKFSKRYKELIQNMFGAELVEEQLKKILIEKFHIIQLDYNLILINFSDKENYEKVKNIFTTHQLFFHESIDEKELQVIQKCFLNENKTLLDSGYLKKENDYLLFINNSNIFSKSKIETKCFDSNKVSSLIKKSDYSDIYSKLFFVKKSGELENLISKSIKGFVLELKKSEKSNNDNFYHFTFYLDENGKNVLTFFTGKNINKKIFISDKSQIFSNSILKSEINSGAFLLKWNLSNENFQDRYDFIRFEVFKNSITIQ